MQSLGDVPGLQRRRRTVGRHEAKQANAELPNVLRADPGAYVSERAYTSRSTHRFLNIVKFCVIAVVTATVAIGVVPRLPTNLVASIAKLDQSIVSSGLGISHVAVTGQHKTSLNEIFDAVALDEPRSFLTFDSHAARARIEKLPWVARARLIRILPDTLAVHVTERQPYAVWQRRGMLFLMDAEGHVLEPVSPDAYNSLPMFVGDGAAEAAPEMLKTLSDHTDLVRRLAAIVRVAERRWTLKLKSGIQVHLPAQGMPETLAQLARLHATEAILDRALDAIDFRLPGQIFVRLSQVPVKTRHSTKSIRDSAHADSDA